MNTSELFKTLKGIAEICQIPLEVTSALVIGIQKEHITDIQVTPVPDNYTVDFLVITKNREVSYSYNFKPEAFIIATQNLKNAYHSTEKETGTKGDK